jgi:hypothetical protein
VDQVMPVMVVGVLKEQ